MRVTAAGAAVTLLAAALAPAAAATEPGWMAAAWDPLSELGVGGAPGDHQFLGVDALSPDEAFAVGVGDSQRIVRARRWNGTRWLPTRPPGGPASALTDVAVLARRDAWAVGGAQGKSLALHWDGAQWTRVPTPAYPEGTEVFKSVAGTGPDDIWAVGYAEPYESQEYYPVIVHWDGGEWSRVPTGLPDGTTGLLQGVTAISATDAWAVGFYTGERYGPMLLHWDGESWESKEDVIQPVFGKEGVGVLFAVDAVSADDVWAVGAGPGSATLLHWNGRMWIQLPSPTDRDRGLDLLYGVAAVSTDDVWAVGGYGERTPPEQAQILHWNGSRWRPVRTPSPGLTGNLLFGVSGTRPDDAWAVGTKTDDLDETFQFLILHWDGDRWTRARFGHLAADTAGTQLS